MKGLKITKGEWIKTTYDFGIVIETDDDLVAELPDNTPDGDGALIADAGNTAQKCGLLPSELLKQRDELREALKELYEFTERLHGKSMIGKPIRVRTKAIITKAEER